MSLKRSIAFLAGIVCILLVSCDNIFYSIASSGEKKPNAGEYTVIFDNNGGDTEADPQIMAAKAPSFTVMLPNVEPEWDGYIFTGWNTSPDGSGTELTRGTSLRANITVYAQWLELPSGSSYVVTFNKNNTDDNSQEAAPQKKAVISPDTTIDKLPSEPIRTGYYFTGWKEGGGAPFDENTPVNGNMTVYAQWDPYKCIVTFNKNTTDVDSEEADPAEKTVTYPDINVGTLPSDPTRAGYDFTGWNTRANGSGNAFNQTTPVGILNNKAITVYAQWKEKSYTISGTVTKSDGGGASGAAVELRLNGNRIARVIADAQGEYAISGVLSRNNYSIQASLTGYSTETKTFNMPKNDETIDFVLEKLCSVTFDSNGGSDVAPLTVNPGATAKKPANPTKIGHTFDNWYDNASLSAVYEFSTPVTDDIILYAKWIAISYTVIFNSNGGSGSMPNQPFTYDVAQDLNANTFTRTGYTFAGWATTSTGVAVYADEQNVDNLATENNKNVTLYAKWAAHSYTVVYDKNADDATGTMGNSTHAYGVSQALTNNVYGRAGYAFVGWNTEDDGSGTNYTNGQSVLNLTTENNATVTLFARWASAYNVTFNKNNTDADSTEANPPTKPVIFPTTNVGSLPTAPRRTGYTFNGWNTESDGSGTAFTATTAVTADIPVYAQWTPISYTITYRDVGGGTFSGTHGSGYPTRHTFGSATTLVSPAKTGYSFGGWFINSNESGGAVASLSATDYAANITLYAKWTANSYTINYRDVGGGTFSGSHGPGYPTSHTYGTATPLVSATKAGHTFGGWFINENGSGSAVTSLSATGYTANITLHAKWTVATYTINYRDVDGGTFSGSHGSGYPTRHTYGTETQLASATKAGYTFGGWFVNENGSGTVLTTLSATGYTANITLHAKWTGNTYDIVYRDDNGDPFSGTHRLGHPTTHTYGTATTLVSPEEPVGKTFAGWFYNNTGSAVTTLSATGNYTDPINLYARWTEQKYTITYDINGGTGTTPSSQSVNYGDNFTTHNGSGFTRVGYTFNGWNINAAGNGTNYAAGVSIPASNLDLYAKWTANTYTVTFNENGGSGYIADQNFTYDVSQNLNTNTFTPPAGYTFAGWAMSTGGSVLYTDGQLVSNLSNSQGATVPLFAKWDIIQYTVIFSANNATSGTAPSSQTVNAGAAITIPNQNGLERIGYTFGGWNTNATGTGTDYAVGSSYTVTGTATLYAKWNRNEYTVSFDLNGGDGTTPPSQTRYYEDTITLPYPDDYEISRLGYIFGGWNTKATGDEYNYSAGTTTYHVMETHTLYAKWDFIAEYTVSFDRNNATSGTAPGSQTVTTGTYITLPDQNGLERTGYAFGGWSLRTDGMGTFYSVGYSYRVDSSITLFAKWNPLITVSGAIALEEGGTGYVGDIVIQLYRYNEGTNVLEPVGKAENPVASNQDNGVYTVTGELTDGYIYFITASLPGYETRVISVSPPGGTVDLTLFLEARRSLPRSVEQKIMELMQGGFRN
jgi:uncharacterized repeat protein (TIGR02543 family)